MIRRCISASLYKLCAMFGGLDTAPVVYILIACCFAAFAATLEAPSPDRVTLAVYDACGGEYSAEFVEAMACYEGIDVIRVSSKEAGEDELLKGRAEVLLTVSESYDEKLTSSEATELISLETAPGAVSAELIREAAAGIMLSRRSLATVSAELAAEGFDPSEMSVYMREFDLPKLYSVETAGSSSEAGRAVFGGAYACYEGIVALALLLLLLTLSRRMTDGASRVSANKLFSALHGRAIAFVSDVGALWLAGAIVVCIALPFAARITPALVLGLVAYDVCIAGLCLLVSRFGSAGRLDIAAPIVALATSVIGGCFIDLGSLSPALKTLARFTPQGQLIAAAAGEVPFIILLAAEGALFALLSLMVSRRAGK